MKKLLLLLSILFSLHAISYASFPVTDSEDSKTKTELTDLENSKIVSESSNSLSPAVSGSGKGMSVAAMVCGIAGIFFGGVILGPLAIIFGAIGMKRDGRGMAITGLICGIVALLGALIIIGSMA